MSALSWAGARIALIEPGVKISQGDHGRSRANYRCCLPALAGFVSPQSMGPGRNECGLEQTLVQGEIPKFDAACVAEV